LSVSQNSSQAVPSRMRRVDSSSISANLAA
jgi:hypothetical protein